MQTNLSDFSSSQHAIRVEFGRDGSMVIVPNDVFPKAFSDEQNSIAAVVGEEHTFVMMDLGGRLRFHIMSLSRPWTEADLERSSPVCGMTERTLPRPHGHPLSTHCSSGPNCGQPAPGQIGSTSGRMLKRRSIIGEVPCCQTGQPSQQIP